MKIAIEGCAHGQLDEIYDTIEEIEKTENTKIDLLIICGDFQATRNPGDLHCMAVPNKYKTLGTFYKYYNGEKKAPMLTLFIGGNHEASNYMQELPYGGWVAPNIYYMGYASVLNFGDIRIGGISGIFKPNNFGKGLYEIIPYNHSSLRSVYHYRNLQFFRMTQLKPNNMDIFLTHDWPVGITEHGDWKSLIKYKPFFVEEINQGTLGSPPSMDLLHYLQPDYWFSAHLHTKFSAVVQHSGGNVTKFLALDKCLPNRKFLQIIEINKSVGKLKLDLEWLSILKNTDQLMSLNSSLNYMPGKNSSELNRFTTSEQELNDIKEDFGGDMTIPDNFQITSPCYSENQNKNYGYPKRYINPQTVLLCTMLGIRDPTTAIAGKGLEKSKDNINVETVRNPDEFVLSDSDN